MFEVTTNVSLRYSLQLSLQICVRGNGVNYAATVCKFLHPTVMDDLLLNEKKRLIQTNFIRPKHKINDPRYLLKL